MGIRTVQKGFEVYWSTLTNIKSRSVCFFSLEYSKTSLTPVVPGQMVVFEVGFSQKKVEWWYQTVGKICCNSLSQIKPDAHDRL